MLGLPNELDLEEWQAEALEAVGPERDTLVLGNRAAKPVDEAKLAAALRRIEGIDRVKSLVVQPSSCVQDIRFVASLPSLDELRAKLVGMIQTPATRIAGVLQAPGGQLARVFAAYAKKGEAA